MLLKTWHFRYYTVATLDTADSLWGLLLLFVYCIYSLARSFQWSLFPHPPSVWSPWWSSSRGKGFGYSQSYHKMSAALARLPVSFPDKTQLLSITTCQFTALLFSMMLWSINCSKDWSKQIAAPLKRGQCLRFILTPGGLLPAHFYPGSLQQASQTMVYLSPIHLPLSSSLPFTISTVSEGTLGLGLFYTLLQIKLVILERDAELYFIMLSHVSGLWATSGDRGALQNDNPTMRPQCLVEWREREL